MSKNKFIVLIWGFIWQRWLLDFRGNKQTVVKVLGWRTAIVDSNCGKRERMSPCFSIFGFNFD